MPDCSKLALAVLKLLLAGLQMLMAEAVERLGVPGLAGLAAIALLALGVSARLFKLMTLPRGMAVTAGLLLAVVAIMTKQPQQHEPPTASYSASPVLSAPVAALPPAPAKAVAASSPLIPLDRYC